MAKEAAGPTGPLPVDETKKSEGNLLIHFNLQEPVEALQGQGANWQQHYTFMLCGTNLTAEAVPTAKATAEYEQEPNKWVAFDKVQLGVKNPPNSREWYTWNNDHKQNFPANDTKLFMVRCSIDFKGVNHWAQTQR